MSDTETLEKPAKGKAKDPAPVPSFIIERDAFLAAIRTVGQVVESRNTIPILSNLLLEAEPGGMLRIRGTDLNMMAEVRVPCDCQVALAATAAEAGLVSAIETLRQGGQVQVTLEDGGWRLLLSQNRATRRLPVLPASDFPPLVLEACEAEFEMGATELLALIEPASVAMSQEEVARAYLCGVFLHAHVEVGVPDGQTLRAAAIDGNQLVRVIVPQPKGAETLPDVILSRKTVNLLRRLLDAHSDCTVIVRADAKKVSVAMGRTMLTAKVVEGTFPAYEKSIPRGCDKILRVHSAELRRCLSAAAALAETRGKARAISLELSPEGCQARAGSTAGAVIDPLDAEFPHEAMAIGVNERLAGPLVGVFGEASQLEVAIDGPGKPIIITSPTRPAITGVLGGFTI